MLQNIKFESFLLQFKPVVISEPLCFGQVEATGVFLPLLQSFMNLKTCCAYYSSSFLKAKLYQDFQIFLPDHVLYTLMMLLVFVWIVFN